MMDSESQVDISSVKKNRMFPSVRLLITVLAFVGCFVRQASNSALNFSIVCMVNSSVYIEQHRNATSCAWLGTNGYHGTYDWDKKTQSYVVAAQNIGTVALVLAGGVICDKFGVKRIYTAAMGILCVTNLIIPVISDRLGWVGLFVVRFLQGSAMVVGWPALLVISNQWFVGGETTFFLSVSSSGTLIGAMASMLIAGSFCRHGGWRYTYYLLGTLSGAVCLAWMVLYFDRIEDAFFVHRSERHYIVKGRKWTHEQHAIPWKSLLTSVPVWAILVINFGNMYMFYFVSQSSPTYYKEVLGIDSSASAFLAALPYLCQLIGRYIGSSVMHACEGKISITGFVKLATIPSGIIPGVLMFVVTAFHCETKYGAVATFAVSFFFFSWILVGFIKATGAIAPQYTGTISGLSNTAMYAAAVVCPFITGALTPHSSVSEWRLALYVTGSICILGSTFFIICGSAEIQPWAVLPRKDNSNEEFEKLIDDANNIRYG